eukprot:scaffold510_cov242-Pinguiococcus_pyrenoidosus.AAC.9
MDGAKRDLVLVRRIVGTVRVGLGDPRNARLRAALRAEGPAVNQGDAVPHTLLIHVAPRLKVVQRVEDQRLLLPELVVEDVLRLRRQLLGEGLGLQLRIDALARRHRRRGFRLAHVVLREEHLPAEVADLDRVHGRKDLQQLTSDGTGPDDKDIHRLQPLLELGAKQRLVTVLRQKLVQLQRVKIEELPHGNENARDRLERLLRCERSHDRGDGEDLGLFRRRKRAHQLGIRFEPGLCLARAQKGVDILAKRLRSVEQRLRVGSLLLASRLPAAIAVVEAGVQRYLPIEVELSEVRGHHVRCKQGLLERLILHDHGLLDLQKGGTGERLHSATVFGDAAGKDGVVALERLRRLRLHGEDHRVADALDAPEADSVAAVQPMRVVLQRPDKQSLARVGLHHLNPGEQLGLGGLRILVLHGEGVPEVAEEAPKHAPSVHGDQVDALAPRELVDPQGVASGPVAEHDDVHLLALQHLLQVSSQSELLYSTGFRRRQSLQRSLHHVRPRGAQIHVLRGAIVQSLQVLVADGALVAQQKAGDAAQHQILAQLESAAAQADHEHLTSGQALLRRDAHGVNLPAEEIRIHLRRAISGQFGAGRATSSHPQQERYMPEHAEPPQTLESAGVGRARGAKPGTPDSPSLDLEAEESGCEA